jgi:hypothetical protein
MKLILEQSFDYSINEDVEKGFYIEGIFSTANVFNGNNRLYKKEILEREIDSLIESNVKNKSAFGELGHSMNTDINLDRVSIITTELKWDGDNVIGKAKVLDTPMGKIAKVLVKEGKLGISSRGTGTVDEDNYVNDDFKLITYDLVGDPSNQGSWVNGIYEMNQSIKIEDVKKEYHRKIWQVLTDIEKSL